MYLLDLTLDPVRISGALCGVAAGLALLRLFTALFGVWPDQQKERVERMRIALLMLVAVGFLVMWVGMVALVTQS